MEIVILLVFLAAGVGLVVGFGALVFGKGAATQRAKQMDDLDRICDELFDGKPSVVYDSHDASLDVDVVTEQAQQRGYRLVSAVPGKFGVTSKVLTFERA